MSPLQCLAESDSGVLDAQHRFLLALGDSSQRPTP
jgi:hypothetical protein